MKKRDLIIQRLVTAIFSLMILAGAITYFVQYEMVSEMFTSLGVPTGVIYPLAIVKILGIAAIWLVKNPMIKKLAYLGFALDLVMAIIAHLNAGDGGAFGPAIPLLLLIVSYVFYRKTISLE
ncbi:DoxX family protein [Roseivirga sp. E12]|uniref:DoxX family protein n=1 Tax=Roseivirga sp. E12 TaxID=2819237 RepID=UPI001ABC1FB5|nr:DoxX family protein [Roseivirga sp. E12]MBO3698086.1 DoxX family protein [Roseivirga sp. E12]